MISVSKFRKKLGPRARLMSDSQIVRLRDAQYQLADIMFDKWLKNKKSRKNKGETQEAPRFNSSYYFVILKPNTTTPEAFHNSQASYCCAYTKAIVD